MSGIRSSSQELDSSGEGGGRRGRGSEGGNDGREGGRGGGCGLKNVLHRWSPFSFSRLGFVFCS